MSTQRIDGKISTTVKLENTEPPSRRNSKSKPRAEQVVRCDITKSVLMHAVRHVDVRHPSAEQRRQFERGWNPCFLLVSTEPTHQRMWDNPWRRQRMGVLSWSNRSLKPHDERGR